MKIATVVGARPQFVKGAPVSAAMAVAGITELIVHTGQHYDRAMSDLFFEEMRIPEPAVNLGVGSGTHGQQTAQMIVGIERILMEERPDAVLVYGDTNSTLAGALAAAKLEIPVGHVEAGLRSFNRVMPEELNRVLTDHLATQCFCPTTTSVRNLAAEGITAGVHLVGDTMYDALIGFRVVAARTSRVLARLELAPRSYYLATIHRPYNTNDGARLAEIFAGFAALEFPVIFPAHPRTLSAALALTEGVLDGPAVSNVRVIPPLGYLDMLVLQEHARAILTDSGGVQKEAYLLGVPCCTIRPETEWVETVQTGWNTLVNAERGDILRAVADSRPRRGPRPDLFGDGHAAERIVEMLVAGSPARIPSVRSTSERQ